MSLFRQCDYENCTPKHTRCPIQLNDDSEEASESFDGEDSRMTVSEVSDHWGDSGQD